MSQVKVQVPDSADRRLLLLSAADRRLSPARPPLAGASERARAKSVKIGTRFTPDRLLTRRGRKTRGTVKAAGWWASALTDAPRITDARSLTHLSGRGGPRKPPSLDGQAAASVGAPPMHGRASQRPAGGCHSGGGHRCARPGHGHGQLRDSIRTKALRGGVAAPLVLLALASTVPVVQGTGV